MESLNKHIQNCWEIHRGQTRKHDNATPYAVHPIWCAMSLLQEENLPLNLRQKGAIALLYHDGLEGVGNSELTKKFLKDRPDILKIVEEMTFEDIYDEDKNIWQKDDFILFLKLYDKVSNMLDGNWMEFPKDYFYEHYIETLTDALDGTSFRNTKIIEISRGLFEND